MRSIRPILSAMSLLGVVLCTPLSAATNVGEIVQDWEDWSNSLRFTTKRLRTNDVASKLRLDTQYFREQSRGYWRIKDESEGGTIVGLFNERYLSVIETADGEENWRVTKLHVGQPEDSPLAYIIDQMAAERDIFLTKGWWFDLPKRPEYHTEYDSAKNALTTTFRRDPELSNYDMEPIEVTYRLRETKPFLPTSIDGRTRLANFRINIEDWHQVNDLWVWGHASSQMKPKDSTSFEPFQESEFEILLDESINPEACYLSYYGLPEPDSVGIFRPLFIMIVIGLVAVTLTWFVRRSWQTE